MALKIKHIRLFNLFGFTHISGSINIDKDIPATVNGGATNQKKCEEEKTEQLEEKKK